MTPLLLCHFIENKLSLQIPEFSGVRLRKNKDCRSCCLRCDLDKIFEVKEKRNRLILLCFVVILVISFYVSGLNEHLTLESIQANLADIRKDYQQNPIQLTAMFIGIYILITSLSIPGTIILTLMSGAIFGTLYGTLYVTFSSAMGATVAFLLSRYLFKDTVQKKFNRKLKEINEKLKEHGNSYLFTLRVLPASPYVVINLLMGLTNIKIVNFSVITFFGMLPGTFIYVMAGRKIMQIKDPADVLSFEIILALCLLGVSPLLVKLFRKSDKLVRHSC